MIPARTAQPKIPDFQPSLPWQVQWRDAIRDPQTLLAQLGLEPLAARVSTKAMQQFALRVPQAFAARMEMGNPNDPLLRQVLPLDDEERLVPGFALDAVGDAAAKAGNGLIRKYQGRALLIATGSCAINCRYCFRRHFPYAEETAAQNGWREVLAAIAADDSIEEVILSGGDPLSLATSKLAGLTEPLARIPHIKRLRIHSRLPVVLPARIDLPLLKWLNTLPWPVAFVIHANHANEFDEEVDFALGQLRATGALLLNQAVLLKGVNDSLDALAALSERNFAAGVLPYYLHQLDRVQGAAHFEVSDARALELHRQLAARLSGYLVPRLVREVAGDTGKRPLTANFRDTVQVL